MGYIHIPNLSRDDSVLQFRLVFASEKVDGTSASVSWSRVSNEEAEEEISRHGLRKVGDSMFVGRTAPNTSVRLYKLEDYHGSVSNADGYGRMEHRAGCHDPDDFAERIMDGSIVQGVMRKAEAVGKDPLDTPFTVHGELYGGKLQGMSKTYGQEVRFIAFDVLVNGRWLPMDLAAEFCSSIGVDFVPVTVVADPSEERLTRLRDSPSEVARRNGCSGNKDRYGNCPPIREGIVIRPTREFFTSRMERVIAKFKRPEFSETKSRKDCAFKASEEDEAKTASILESVDEWVVDTRLSHVLDKLSMPNPEKSDLRRSGEVIKAMVEDVTREGGLKELVSKPGKGWGENAVKTFNDRKRRIMSRLSSKTMELFKGRIGIL